MSFWWWLVIGIAIGVGAILVFTALGSRAFPAQRDIEDPERLR